MSARDGDDLSLVIHELRDPLVGIDAAARVLERELGTHPAGRRASQIASEARHLIGLLDGVADAEAAAAGRLRCVLRDADLAALVRETVAAKQLAGRRVTVRGADAPVVVRADTTRMRQVIANLLANADQYSPAGRAVDVELAMDRRRGRARVTVRDHGPGIAAGDRRRLFRRYTRLRTADGTRGSGLGLYICRAIVEDHGGKIAYRTANGGGSAFTFDVPLTKATRR